MKSEFLTKKIKKSAITMEKQSKTILEEIQGTVDEIINQIRKLITEGNARRVIIKNKHGKVLFQSQLTIGAAGLTFFVFYAPVITAVTTLLLVANDVSVIIEREVDEDNDEYEVKAEVIEIKDEDEVDEDEPKTDETDKTVGKNKK
jgi:hypothetical protein